MLRPVRCVAIQFGCVAHRVRCVAIQLGCVATGSLCYDPIWLRCVPDWLRYAPSSLRYAPLSDSSTKRRQPNKLGCPPVLPIITYRLSAPSEQIRSGHLSPCLLAPTTLVFLHAPSYLSLATTAPSRRLFPYELSVDLPFCRVR